MTQTVDVQDVVDAVIARLRERCSFPIGDHEAPGDLDELVDDEQRWGIVYHVPGGATMGDNARLSSVRVLVFQFTGVGDERDKAQWAAQRMIDAFLSVQTTINPQTSKVMGRWHTESAGADRIGTLWNAVEKCAVMVSP